MIIEIDDRIPWAHRMQNRTRARAKSMTVWWEASEVETLVRLYHAGVTQPEIARTLNRTFYAVSSKLTKLRKAGEIQ